MSTMHKGDTVRWRADISADRTPMVVYEVHGAAVRVDGPAGSLIAANLLVPVETRREPMADLISEGKAELAQRAEEDAGLLSVIEAQMGVLDDLQRELSQANDDMAALRVLLAKSENELAAAEAYKAGSEDGFREEVERMLGNVCLALGFDRRPAKTGIMELDALVRYVEDQ